MHIIYNMHKILNIKKNNKLIPTTNKIHSLSSIINLKKPTTSSSMNMANLIYSPTTMINNNNNNNNNKNLFFMNSTVSVVSIVHDITSGQDIPVQEINHPSVEVIPSRVVSIPMVENVPVQEVNHPSVEVIPDEEANKIIQKNLIFEFFYVNPPSVKDIPAEEVKLPMVEDIPAEEVLTRIHI